MKKIVIFGESHTRSFAFIDGVIPVFMDSGKSINLGDTHIGTVKQKILTLKKILPEDDYLFFTFLGEPNIRYQLNDDWYIHKDTNFKYKGEVNENYLDRCVSNYKKLYDELGFITGVITPTTAFQPSIKSMIYFNDKLKSVFGEDNVVDVFKFTLDGNEVKKEYRDPNFKDDPVHLNSNVADDFISILREKGLISDDDSYIRTKDLVYSNHLKDTFNKNRFGTFKLK